VYEIKRFPYEGTVDADGHVLEPAWSWERYLERAYADRAIRIKTDENGSSIWRSTGARASAP
jgi:hypothetical protein